MIFISLIVTDCLTHCTKYKAEAKINNVNVLHKVDWKRFYLFINFLIFPFLTVVNRNFPTHTVIYI